MEYAYNPLVKMDNCHIELIYAFVFGIFFGFILNLFIAEVRNIWKQRHTLIIKIGCISAMFYCVYVFSKEIKDINKFLR